MVGACACQAPFQAQCVFHHPPVFTPETTRRSGLCPLDSRDSVITALGTIPWSSKPHLPLMLHLMAVI